MDNEVLFTSYFGVMRNTRQCACAHSLMLFLKWVTNSCLVGHKDAKHLLLPMPNDLRKDQNTRQGFSNESKC